MIKKIKFISCMLIGLAIIYSSNVSAFPAENDNEKDFHYTCFVQEELTEEAKQLNIFLADYFDAYENHDMEKLKGLYADEFISGDGFKKSNMMKIIGESWELSPKLTYSSEIQDVKINDKFATVEINENLTGLTKDDSDITGDKGFIESSTRTVLHLKKFGKGWKIITDNTLYEETSIKYGKAKELDVNIHAPEQVFTDDKYTISLKTEIPEDMFAVGSIIRESLTYPREKTDEIFRQIPMDIKLLERVVQANNKSLNELAVVSVSYCKVEKDTFKRPEINLVGTAVLIKRINVRNLPAAI